VCLAATAATSILLTFGAFACGNTEFAQAELAEAELLEAEIAPTEPVAMAAIAPSGTDKKDAAEAVDSAGGVAGPFFLLSSDDAIIGTASFYDEPQRTASGEQYDPDAFTAAAQIELRQKFGGVRFGRLYQPAYALVEYAKKKLILRINDVGPLRPGRVIDLSRAAFAYFENLEKGLLPGFKVTPLPLGQAYEPGPVTDTQLALLGFAESDIGFVPTSGAPKPEGVEIAAVSPSAEPTQTQADNVTIMAELRGALR
jgi:rare lipoprotein A